MAKDEDDLLEPEESEATIPALPADEGELTLADEEPTEELDVGEATDVGGDAAEETEVVEEVEGEAQVEETLEAGAGEESVEEAAGAAGAPQMVEGPPAKARDDVYTTMLILSCVLFGVAIWLAGDELHQFYAWTAFGMLE